MSMHEDLRQALVSSYKAAHEVAYPAVPINYPGREAYNPETATDPFVVMTYEYIPEQLGISQEDSIKSYDINGNLRITYFYRPNSGLSQATNFADFLTTSFGLKVVGGITFRSVRPYPNAGMAGWEGMLFVIPFKVQYFGIA